MATSVNPLQRLVTITSVLAVAGSQGRDAAELAAVVGYGGTPESQRESLARDIRALGRIGISITNEAPFGETGRWVLHPRDSRVALALSPEQRAELARAAVLAGRLGLANRLDDAPAGAEGSIHIQAGDLPRAMDDVLRAVSARCVLRFDYNGRARELDPDSLHGLGGQWTVSGVERGSGQSRSFAVSRMSHVRVDVPGSARSHELPQPTSRDPLQWAMDPPVMATLEYETQFAPDVRRLLNVAGPGLPGAVESVEVTVTNRWIFLSRLMGLGERVRLVGPPDLRSELRERLLAIEAAG